MKTVTPALKTLLDSGRYLTANLYTLTLLGGSATYYTDAPDFSAIYQNHTYSHDALIIERGSIKQAVGLEVDSVDMTVYFQPSTTLGGLPVPHFVRNGGFNGARMLVQRAFFAIDVAGNASPNATGVIFSFEGRLGDPKPSRTQIEFKLIADTELLKIMVPTNTITPYCLNRVFDGRCGLNRNAYSHTSTVTTASRTEIACALSQPDGYYTLGTVRFTSGLNAGASRSVKSYSTGHFVLVSALEYLPAPGDTFIAVAGCDLSESVCNSRFNNLANRRAFPWVPAYEENL